MISTPKEEDSLSRGTPQKGALREIVKRKKETERRK
jgi:hypothetical protein